MADFTTWDEARLFIALSAMPVLVHLSADCTPCAAIAPILDEIARRYNGRVLRLTVNADEARNAVKQFYGEELSALLLFEGGAVLARHTSKAAGGTLSASRHPGCR